MRISPSGLRRSAMVCLALAALCVALIIAGLVRPFALEVGKPAAVFGNGVVGLAWGSAPVQATWMKQLEWPLWGFKDIQAKILVAPVGSVSPQITSGSIAISPGSRYTLTVLWLPLWIPAAILTLVGIAGFVAARRMRRPECCVGCGYDLSGLTGKCPECGAVR